MVGYQEAPQAALVLTIAWPVAIMPYDVYYFLAISATLVIANKNSILFTGFPYSSSWPSSPIDDDDAWWLNGLGANNSRIRGRTSS